MEDIKTKINNTLKEAGVLDKIKSLFVKMSEQPVAAAEMPVAPVEVEKPEIKLADGTSIIVEGEIKEGAKVSMVTPEGMVEVKDGDYPAEDKTVYTITAGVISKITPSIVEVEPVTEDMPTLMSKLNARLEAIESRFVKENTDLQTKLSEQSKTLKVAFEALKAISEMPSDKPLEVDLSKAELTPLQRHRMVKELVKEKGF